MKRQDFYLGTHEPSWLAKAGFALFVSHVRLRTRKTLPRAIAPWALDSGGFSALDSAGKWDMTARRYVAAVRRYRDEIGMLRWAAPMDWMCEPRVRAKTGKTVAEHLYLTVESFLTLRGMAPDLPFIPVLQGWSLPDYLRCIDLYVAEGVDLTRFPVVGIGSVCRRQATSEIGAIVSAVADRGIRLHGFGVKTKGLAQYGPELVSADSMAWSFRGRHVQGCGRGRHVTEANCMGFAADWRRHLLDGLEGADAAPRQLALI